MSDEAMFYTPDITAAIDQIIAYLKAGDQNRQALMRANLLLTNLMRLLRPIPNPTRALDSARMLYAAEQLGLGITRVRLLKAAVIRGVSEIERGQYTAVRETFTTARNAWTLQE
jgi:hypothetical protein